MRDKKDWFWFNNIQFNFRSIVSKWPYDSNGWMNEWNTKTSVKIIHSISDWIINWLVLYVYIKCFYTVGDLKYLSLTKTNRIWTPELFFSNEKESHFHNIIVPNLYVRIYPNGSILYSLRISLTLSCPMNFQLYPFDRQYCPIKMAPCKCWWYFIQRTSNDFEHF